MLGRTRRLAILAEGEFTRLDAKTAVGVLRYRGSQVAAVIDSTRAGRTAEACVGTGGSVPVVASLADAAAAGADSLLLGTAPVGGALPGPWRDIVCAALARGWDVLSGLHVFLGDDPEFAALAARHGATLYDVRRPAPGAPVAAQRAADVAAFVVLTVGTDCNVGKMTTALEAQRALERAGTKVAFVATGQTGIFIADAGVAVDAVPADFAAGAVERCVLDAAPGAEVVMVEGQGALHHAGYSGVSLALLHGACPQAMVLCHDAARREMGRSSAQHRPVPVPSLAAARAACEAAAAWVRPARVVAVSLQTAALDEPAARAACDAAARETGLPATDPVRFGAGPIAEAILAAREVARPRAGEGRVHAPSA